MSLATLDPHDVMRAKVQHIESMMLEMEQVECPVTHHYAPGIYAREAFIPKGSLVTGKIHKHAHLNIMSAGVLDVLTENGIQRVTAPFTLVSPPGTKRIAYAHEDTVWTTIHATEETDLKLIEAEFIASSEAEYLAFCDARAKVGVQKCLG